MQLDFILTGEIAAKSQGMRTTITKLFDLVILKNKLDDVVIESGSVKRYKTDNPGGKLQAILLPCVPWKQQLQKHFDSTIQQNSPFLFITGILICEDLKVRWTIKNAVSWVLA